MVKFSDRVVVPPHVLIHRLDGEAVLLNLQTEKYFGLDATGTRMWEVATQATSLEQAHATLLQEFDVDPETLRANFADLMVRLIENGLLQRSSADVGSLPAI